MLSKEKERFVSIHNQKLKTNDFIQLKEKREYGITLVALVVTIIVLLILARSFSKYGT